MSGILIFFSISFLADYFVWWTVENNWKAKIGPYLLQIRNNLRPWDQRVPSCWRSLNACKWLETYRGHAWLKQLSVYREINAISKVVCNCKPTTGASPQPERLGSSGENVVRYQFRSMTFCFSIRAWNLWIMWDLVDRRSLGLVIHMDCAYTMEWVMEIQPW